MTQPAPVAQNALRILQVSTADVRGGAEQVAWNLFAEYRARGHGSWLAVGKKYGQDPDVWPLPNDRTRTRWARAWHRAADRIRAGGGGRTATTLGTLARGLAEPSRGLDRYRGREDFHFPGTQELLELVGQRPDVVHAHNLHGGYFDLRLLPWLSRQVPLIVTLHDAWLLSGHCAHSFACDRWRTGCGRCPDLTIYPAVRRDSTAYNWRRKRDIFARSRFAVATPSQWLMGKVEQSMLARNVREARVIPNGVDLSSFRPGDRRAARKALGLPPDAPILLTTGIDLGHNRWKDLPTLREAVARLTEQWSGPRIQLLVLGTSAPPEPLGGAVLRFIPHQLDAAAVAAYYQAADVYVHAARTDTFPLAVLEALACGTPVVASNVGGIPEQVEEARSGFLVSAGDAPALAARLHMLLSDAGLRARLGRHGAQEARRRFDFRLQVDAYLEWYAELVGGTAASPAA